MKNFLFSKKIFFVFLFVGCLNSVFSQSFIKGADLSYLQEIEDSNAIFYDEFNNQIPNLIPFFAQKGLDCVRFRVWVNPEKYCNLENTIKMASRVKESGMKILIDFHYSDSWADPAQQNIPSKWQEKISQLNESDAKIKLQEFVFDYTKSSLQKFKNVGIEVDYIQIGNEITNGLLWPYGKIKDSGSDKQKFSDTAKFLEQGISGAKKLFPQAKIILHLDCSSDINRCLWWFNLAKNANLDFDIIGLSYYSLWHGTDLTKLENCVKTLSQKFNKSVFIVETAYPWTLGWNDNLSNLYGMKNQLIKEFPATTKGQNSYLDELSKIVKKANGKFDSAVFWWEPTAISVKGKFNSTIENLTWFDFSNKYIGPK